MHQGTPTGPISLNPETGVASSQNHSPFDPHFFAESLEQVYSEYSFGTWSGSYWAFAGMFRADLADSCGIVDDEWGFHRRDYLDCVRPTVKGKVHLSIKDGSAQAVSRFRCYDPACPDCRDYDREKQALEYVDLIQKIVDLHPGCRKIWRFQFTLPRLVEAAPFADRDLEKRLLDGIHAVIRKALGFGPRSNVPVIVAVHPVGDTDFYRDRWHVHCTVLPCEVTRTSLTWGAVDWIDVEKLHADWAAVVDGAVIPPQVSYVDPTKEGWRGSLYEKVRYDVRGFGKDLDKAVASTNRAAHLVAVRHRKIFRVVESVDLVNRYLWVRKHNLLRTWGFFRCIDSYQEVLGFCRDDLKYELPEDTIEVEADVTLVRMWQRDPQGRLVFIKDEVYLYECPFRGKVVALVRSKEVDLADVDDYIRKRFK